MPKPVQPITEHYRCTYEICCPTLPEAQSDYQLLTVNPFLQPGSGYVLLIKPDELLTQWRSSCFTNAARPKTLRTGLSGYRAMRFLRHSHEAPVSMPAVRISDPVADKCLGMFMEPHDAALLEAARLTGCTQMPVFVTGPAITRDHRRNLCLLQAVAKLVISHEVSSWLVSNPLSDSHLTCKAWVRDTEAHADAKGLAKATARIDLLVCAGIMHTDLKYRRELDICTELGMHTLTAARRMKTIDGPPIDLIDRFAAGHDRLARQALKINADGVAHNRHPFSTLDQMVMDLGRAILGNEQASDLAAQLLDAHAQTTLHWLQNEEDITLLPQYGRSATGYLAQNKL